MPISIRRRMCEGLKAPSRKPNSGLMGPTSFVGMLGESSTKFVGALGGCAPRLLHHEYSRAPPTRTSAIPGVGGKPGKPLGEGPSRRSRERPADVLLQVTGSLLELHQ